MRSTATLILFALVAGAVAFAQNVPGTNNNPATTPQTQTPTVPTNGTTPPAHTPQADVPQGSAGQTANSGQTTSSATTAVFDEVGAGTEIHAALDTPLSSKTAKPGDRFTATLSDPVRANNGAVVIPAGARIEGEVAESDDEKTLAALKDKPKLSLRFRDVVLPTGQTVPLTATLVSVHDTSSKSPRKSIAEGGKGSSAIGAAAARSLGGPIKGLAIGTLSGGGYVVATNGKDVRLPAQAVMLIRVDQPLSWNGTSTPLPR
ncbi:MAG TPA: hypothetical protein VGK36_05975 [Candidatus Angelobacter sp.]